VSDACGCLYVFVSFFAGNAVAALSLPPKLQSQSGVVFRHVRYEILFIFFLLLVACVIVWWNRFSRGGDFYVAAIQKPERKGRQHSAGRTFLLRYDIRPDRETRLVSWITALPSSHHTAIAVRYAASARLPSEEIGE
jgi:hypothetical protein